MRLIRVDHDTADPGRVQGGSRVEPGRVQGGARAGPGWVQGGPRAGPGRVQGGFIRVQGGSRVDPGQVQGPPCICFWICLWILSLFPPDLPWICPWIFPSIPLHPLVETSVQGLLCVLRFLGGAPALLPHVDGVLLCGPSSAVRNHPASPLRLGWAIFAGRDGVNSREQRSGPSAFRNPRICRESHSSPLGSHKK